jgi:hypothetical protein
MGNLMGNLMATLKDPICGGSANKASKHLKTKR